jgi:hypothetical protein
MPVHLPHIDQKLHRATEHILQVEQGIKDIIGSIPKAVVSQNDPHAVALLRETLSRIIIPDRLQIVAGEAIHQMRSALDHFAAQLAGSEWHTGTEFPIQINRPEKPDEIGRFERKIKGFSPDAKTLVKRLQPYKVPPERREELLPTILKRLNNRDKHRALLVTAAVAKPLITYKFSSGLHVEFVPDDDADPAVRPFPDTVDVKGQCSVAVVFPKFGLATNYPVVEGLAQLRNWVVGLLRMFRDIP